MGLLVVVLWESMLEYGDRGLYMSFGEREDSRGKSR
jgi:hypothetical protein